MPTKLALNDLSLLHFWLAKEEIHAVPERRNHNF